VNSYPYYDVSNECYARLNTMVETMNEQHEHFLSDVRECGLLHEIDLPFSSLESNIYDDCEFSLS